MRMKKYLQECLRLLLGLLLGMGAHLLLQGVSSSTELETISGSPSLWLCFGTLGNHCLQDNAQVQFKG